MLDNRVHFRMANKLIYKYLKFEEKNNLLDYSLLRDVRLDRKMENKLHLKFLTGGLYSNKEIHSLKEVGSNHKWSRRRRMKT